MSDIDIFVSVGGTSTDEQESFVTAIEERLRSEGLKPHTIGRNTFSSDAPLKAISDLMDGCSGTVVIALERTFCKSGYLRRGGPQEEKFFDARYATPWNQIEAAMSFAKGLPLLVIAENGIRSEGLIDVGHEWYIQRVNLETSCLYTNEFNGILASWKKKLLKARKSHEAESDLSRVSVAEIVGMLKPAQLWASLVAFSAVVAGAFALGLKFPG